MRRALFLAVLLLAGCAGLPREGLAPGDRQAWDARRERLTAQEQWSLAGRIAVFSEQESWHATLEWRQDGPRYTLRLDGPLGSGSARLRGGPDGVLLRGSDGTRLAAADAEGLLAEYLGYAVPVEGLRYWVRGVLEPGRDYRPEYTPDAPRLARLHQAGWDIRFLDYRRHDGLELPRKVFLEGRGFKVRLVVGEWSAAEAVR